VKKWLLSFLIFCATTAVCQDTAFVSHKGSENHVAFRGRQWTVGGLSALGYGGSFVFLSQAWYKDYPRTSFHTFDDNGEWLQMDKIGHAWTAYHTSRFTTNLWRWAGVSPENSILLGAGSSLLYMLSIEYLDGRSAEWGWSWGDAGADILGASLYAGQEWGWKDQRINIKFSSSPEHYGGADLEARADKLFGRSFQGRLLKDYNAQTYWVSANLHAFLPNAKLPAWLNVSVGYGAGGMFGGFENVARDKEGNLTFDRRDIKRYRQWYLAPDVDLTKIKTKSKVLQSVFSALNVLKFPAPALELSNGRLRLKALAY
jgi:hypothetical protein